MALQILFGSDIGVLSLLTIGFVIVIGLYYVWFFTRKMREEQPK